MNKVAAWIIPLVCLIAMAFSTSSRACAQQQPGAASSGSYASQGGSMPAATYASETRSYPSASGDLTGQSASQLPSQQNRSGRNSPSTAASQASAGRSAWKAGSYSVGRSGSAGMAPTAGSFKAGGASWIAGQSDFGLQRQAAGVWRVRQSAAGLPSVGNEATAGAASTLAPDFSDLPAGFSSTTASPVARRASSAGFAPHFGGAAGHFSSPSASHGPKFPAQARRSFASPYRRQSGSFGSSRGVGTEPGIGSGSGLSTPSLTSPAGPSLNDTLNPNSNRGLDSNPQ